MSQVYNTEPAHTGRVILNTTHGPIDIHLFCKECPSTTRTFLQLCMDGYYDNMIFHRILPDFLVQTGLTRGTRTSTSGENDDEATPKQLDRYLRQSTAVPPSSPYSGTDPLGWERKNLEVNPRIRFNHRGQVAAAFPLKGGGGANDDESMSLRYQFFVTLDESPFLDGQHVIFGTISGPTIFNALRVGKTEIEEDTGCPVDMIDSPPRITSVKIDFHPFRDLAVTSETLIPWRIHDNGAVKSKRGQSSEVEKRRKKRKGKRDLNVLSFGDEERDYEMIGKDAAIRSSHDVLHGESDFLSSSVDADLKKMMEKKDESVKVKRKTADEAVSEKKKIKFAQEPAGSEGAQEIRSPINDDPTIQQQQEMSAAKPDKADRVPRDEPKPKKSKSIGAVEARRAKYLKNGHSTASKKERLKREDDTMAKLMLFRNKVLETKSTDSKSTTPNEGQMADDSLASRMAKRMKDAQDAEARALKEKEDMISAPGYHGQVDDESIPSEDDAADQDWMGTKFKCKRHVDHDSRNLDKNAEGGDGRHMDDYLVVDEKKREKGSRHHHHRGRHHRHSGHRSDGRNDEPHRRR